MLLWPGILYHLSAMRRVRQLAWGLHWANLNKKTESYPQVFAVSSRKMFAF